MSDKQQTSRERLKKIIREKSFRSGIEITLASGRVSDFYFNMKPTMMDPEGAALLAELVLEALEGIEADYIGGMEMGAVPIVSFVAPASFIAGKPLKAFFVRKQQKGHGAKKQIEGLEENTSLEGRRVILVEDATTTGGSTLKAAELVRGEGAEIVLVLTLVDRQEGAKEGFAENDLPFKALFTAGEFRSQA